MPRTFGAKSYTTDELNTIREHWKSKSDIQLGRMMGYGEQRIQKMRLVIGLSRKRNNILNKKEIAEILELFANGSTIISIARKLERVDSTISNIINKHYLTKRKSEDTKVIVLQSKINEKFTIVN